MAAKVDLYNSSYGNYELAVYREVRTETYGKDFGQTSWVTTEESCEIPRLLELSRGSYVLEVGSGSGGYALHLAETVGCRVLGVDVNKEGIRNARELARSRNLTDKASFEESDASQRFSFGDETFDAAFSNDVFCHIPGRPHVLRELFRVLKPGGRMIFSDALVVGGPISNEEVATRTSIGYYELFPQGENKKLIEQAGFQLLQSVDTTENAARIAKRRYDARARRTVALLAVEGEANFAGVQRFLSCVHTLTSERRLLRFLYLARKSG
jgi:ubiquinone/menaquinone biosynthesis C-methylase UbiE